MGNLSVETVKEAEMVKPKIEYTIITLTNKDPKFYSIIGPFLAKREIIKALGEPLYDDDGKEWFIAYSDNGEVLGFATARQMKGYIQLSDSYVLAAHRRQGIFNALLNIRLEKYKGQPIRTIANENSVQAFSKKGFQTYRETVNYYFMEKGA